MTFDGVVQTEVAHVPHTVSHECCRKTTEYTADATLVNYLTRYRKRALLLQNVCVGL